MTQANNLSAHKKELYQLLDILRVQTKEIQDFLVELRQIKSSIKQMTTVLSPNLKTLERLSELEKQFSQAELNPGGALARRLERFSVSAEEVDQRFYRLIGPGGSRSHSGKNVRQAKFV